MAAIQGRRRNLQLMTALGVLAGGLYGYTLTVISGALIGMNLGSGPGGHLTAGEQGMVTSALLIGAALGSYLAGRFNDRFGPKRIILAVGLAGTIIFLAAIGVCYRFVGTPGSGSRTAAWIMIGMMMIYVVFVQGLVAPVTWLLLSEIFPQQVKSHGMGYANVAMNLTNFGLSLVFPTLLARLGGTGTYLLFALINVCALVFAWIMVPETRGKSLAQIEQEARARA